MTILQAILIFLAYCIIAAVIRLVERIVEGIMLKRRQDALMDAVYSKLVRLAGRALSDWRQMNGGEAGEV